jgi:hypothetical protein
MYEFMFYLLFYQFIVLLASVIVNIYKEVEKEIEEETEEEEEIKMVPYEEKYKDKIKTINSLVNDKTFLDNLKFSFVMETTPNGNVLMFWDNNRSSFIYYSDTSIPYRYLEVVARKYVIMNNCREIYFIMEEQLKPLKKEEIVEKKEEKNVFAKLKSYNQSSILDTKNIAPKKQNQNTQLPRIQINQKEPDKNDILLKENNIITKPFIEENNLSYNYSYYPILFDNEEILIETKIKLENAGINSRRYFYPSLNKLNYVKIIRNSICNSKVTESYVFTFV